MSEAEQPHSGQKRASAAIDDICHGMREGLEFIVNAITPPESACNHFREARIEVLRGIRDIIDHRIDRLSRNKETGGGTRIVVE
jgi:hypothetical protein